VEYFSPGPPSEFQVLWAQPDRPIAPIPVGMLRPSPELMFRVVE
jgi:hypothetical protein